MASLQEEEEQLQELLRYLKSRLGFDPGSFSTSSTMRAIQRRVAAVGATGLRDYLSLLELQPEEASRLAHSIILNFTGFFRDGAAWRFLAARVLADIAARSSSERPARIWSAGCASGEETYTLAMLMAETLGRTALEKRALIYGTDIDEEALAHARAARYNPDEVRPIPRSLRRRYLERSGGDYLMDGALVRSVTFNRHDLLEDEPLGDVDLVVCRHTLMYFDPSSQLAILARFHRALREEGFLFLESTDRVGDNGSLFASADPRHPLFVRVRDSRGEGPEG